MHRAMKVVTVAFVSMILVLVASNLARVPLLILGVASPGTEYSLTDPLFAVVALLSLAMLASGVVVTYRIGKRIWRYGE